GELGSGEIDLGVIGIEVANGVECTEEERVVDCVKGSGKVKEYEYGVVAIGWDEYEVMAIGWYEYGVMAIGWDEYGVMAIGWDEYGVMAIGLG
ncbi:unnamed protein product, partial [Staurois parvus]